MNNYFNHQMYMNASDDVASSELKVKQKLQR